MAILIEMVRQVATTSNIVPWNRLMSAADPRPYIFGGTDAEQQRLIAQAKGFELRAKWLLDQVGIEPGWRAIDVGCGPIGILNLLSERVGSQGTVVGLEREARFARRARMEIAQRGLSNVTVVQGDVAASGLHLNSFDFAHERLVMINIPGPENLLSEMFELVRPGGIVAAEEVDDASWICQPAHPSWNKLLETFHTAFHAGGGDAFFGRRLPELLRAVGLEEVRFKVHVDAVQPGGYRREHLLALLDSLRDKVITLELMTDDELATHRDALARHLADPNTTVIDQLFVQAWGRKPS